MTFGAGNLRTRYGPFLGIEDMFAISAIRYYCIKPCLYYHAAGWAYRTRRWIFFRNSVFRENTALEKVNWFQAMRTIDYFHKKIIKHSRIFSGMCLGIK